MVQLVLQQIVAISKNWSCTSMHSSQLPKNNNTVIASYFFTVLVQTSNQLHTTNPYNWQKRILYSNAQQMCSAPHS